MKWFFDLLPLRSAATPAQNPSDELLVERNARGGWSLRFAGDRPDQAIGNYASAEDAARIARLNVTQVRVCDTAPEDQATAPVLSNRDFIAAHAARQRARNS